MQEPSHKIRALIFDFGGVLVRTESQEPREKLAKQVDLSRQELYDAVFNCRESRLAQLGRMSSEERWQRIGQALGLHSPEELLAFRREFYTGDVLDAKLVSYIRRMRGRYKTALLSNASAEFAELLHTKFGLDDCFDVIIISALVGMMKPDPAIYYLVLERLQVAPHEAVFVDDMLENVEGAAAVGLHAIRFTTRDAVLKDLDALLGEAQHTQGTDTRQH